MTWLNILRMESRSSATLPIILTTSIRLGPPPSIQPLLYLPETMGDIWSNDCGIGWLGIWLHDGNVNPNHASHFEGYSLILFCVLFNALGYLHFPPRILWGDTLCDHGGESLYQSSWTREVRDSSSLFTITSHSSSDTPELMMNEKPRPLPHSSLVLSFVARDWSMISFLQWWWFLILKFSLTSDLFPQFSWFSTSCLLLRDLEWVIAFSELPWQLFSTILKQLVKSSEYEIYLSPILLCCLIFCHREIQRLNNWYSKIYSRGSHPFTHIHFAD